VAIVGAGVTGLGAAYHLVTSGVDVEVLVYEPSEKAGGHANTVEVDGVPVDVGFMVYNHQNYPNMVELFEELGVEDEVSGLCGGSVRWTQAPRLLAYQDTKSAEPALRGPR
jgi:cyclopropane-fatty-acyl-phospholipid synthase